MSGVVDVRCGGCLVWWMSSVVDVQCGVLWCGVLYDIEWYCMILYCIALYCIKSYVQYYTVLHGIALLYHYWLRRESCISQDTYLLYYIIIFGSFLE